MVVVQHPRERRHPFGTVRIVRLGLTDVDIRVPDPRADGGLQCADPAVAGSALLYPSEDAIELADLRPAPQALVVLDGTWSTARKLVRDNPWIGKLPRVKLHAPRPGNYRIRRAPDPSQQLSTIEAIVFALQTLEGQSPGLSALLAAFDTMVDRQLASRQSAPGTVVTTVACAPSLP